MPSKKRKYNARFPAGRIKKIMQTDEEVGKVAQAVPIIISRTLELFVESLLTKAVQVTVSRNAKTLSPSHVKQCILGEARFDFLRDLVKNIPDVSAAEEKELNGEENSPTSSRFAEPSTAKRCDESTSTTDTRHSLRRTHSTDKEHRKSHSTDKEHRKSHSTDKEHRKSHSTDKEHRKPPSIDKEHRKPETITSTITSAEAIDLTKKETRQANFYQETLPDDSYPSVIQLNPGYAQPSTSAYVNPPDLRLPKPEFFVQPLNNNIASPITPVLNIDFTKNLANPEIKVLDTAVAGIVGAKDRKLPRQYSKTKLDVRKNKPAAVVEESAPLDEDYDT